MKKEDLEHKKIAEETLRDVLREKLSDDSVENQEVYDKNITDENHNNYNRKPKWYREPFKLIIGLFAIFMILAWSIPYYYIRDDPRPVYIPQIDEVFSPIDIQREDIAINSHYDYLLYIDSRHPEVKAVADKIASISCSYSENYRVCHAKALYYFVRDNIVYTRDPVSFEYVKGPLETLNNKAGDCDDMAVLLASLLGSIGIRTRFVFVPNHVYVEAHIPEAFSKYKQYRGEDWIAMDATCRNCNFGKIPLSNVQAEKIYVS